MVGREVGDDGNIRAFSHGVKLKARQLQHRHILRRNGLNVRQQGTSQIASQVHGIALRLQQLCHKRCRGGFAVAPRDGNELAGAQLKKNLHLACDPAAPCTRLLQRGVVKAHSGRFENQLPGKPFQVVFPQVQRHSQLQELLCNRAKLLCRPLVARGDDGALLDQQPDERGIADPDPDNRHIASCNAAVKFLQLFVHKIASVSVSPTVRTKKGLLSARASF